MSFILNSLLLSTSKRTGFSPTRQNKKKKGFHQKERIFRSLSFPPLLFSVKMVAKQLHELLGEDQEPFLLSSYVADRSFLISTEPPVKSQLRSSKQMPASLNSILSGNLRKGSCFFSFPDSPDPRRSPSPTYVKLRSTGNPSSVFLHVPAKKAALLLEAALRIQRNSPPSRPTKSSNGLPLFRQFGSLLKGLTHRNWTKKAKQRRASGGCACRGSYGESRCSSSGFEAGWSSDFEEDHENVGFESKVMDEEDDENRLANPSSGHRSPVISSPPASSPILHELKVRQLTFFLLYGKCQLHFIILIN